MTADSTPTCRAPDLIEPVIGFRHWSVRGDRLFSPFRGDTWDQLELHARCELGTHEPSDVPARDCNCGVYAYYEQPPRSSAATRELVIGAVAVWGELELHAGGMRASHARILALALPPTRGRKRRQLAAAAHYLEVPAVSFRELGRIARRAGSPAPRDLRPPRLMPWDRPVGLGRAQAAGGGVTLRR
jgi:hypothetical protein